MPRACAHWLLSLREYVEDTESPRHFWNWSGISTIASTLQRKVWVNFGMERIFPNLYILLVAKPGESRKGAPLKFSKDILTEMDIPIFADSPTRRALTKAMAKLGETQFFTNPLTKTPEVHCSISLISKELSSFLAQDAKAMIEFLTDGYDSHDRWDHETAGKGKDILNGVCINCFLATTPTWMAYNLPEEAIGGGWASRLVLLHGEGKYKWVTLPPPPNKELYKKLKQDLKSIKFLTGEFVWGDGAYEVFDSWYGGVEEKIRKTKDERLHPYIHRMHIMILKVAMTLHVAQEDKLILLPDDIGQAIDLLEDVLISAPKALAGHGKSRSSADVERLLRDLRIVCPISFAELLKMNFRQTNKIELTEVLETIEAMGNIKMYHPKETPRTTMIEWIGGAEKGSGGKPRRKKE